MFIGTLCAAALLAFVFSVLEAGIPSLDPIQLRKLAGSQELPSAAALEKLLRAPGRLAAALGFLSALAKVVFSALVYSQLRTELGTPLAIVALAGLLPLIFVVLDVLPKSLARIAPYGGAASFARILLLIDRFLAPLDVILLRIFPASVRSISNIPELRAAIDRATSNESLSVLQKHFMHSVLNARSLKAKDFAVPLSDIPSVRADTSISEVLSIARSTGAARVLVLATDGSVLGAIPIFDLLADDVTKGRAQSYARPLPCIPPETSALEALLKLRAARSPLGLILDKEPTSNQKPLSVIQSEPIVRRILQGGRRA